MQVAVVIPSSCCPPASRSQIMRRFLRKIAAGETDVAAMGDASTLADPSVLTALIASRKAA